MKFAKIVLFVEFNQLSKVSMMHFDEVITFCAFLQYSKVERDLKC